MRENILLIILTIFIVFYILYLIKKIFFLKQINSPIKFSKKTKEGYLELLELLYTNANNSTVKQEIHNISVYKTDGRYVGGYSNRTIEFDALSFTLDYFYDLLNFLENRGEILILNINDNTTLNSLHQSFFWVLNDITENIPFLTESNLNLNQELSREILMDYQRKLRANNVQMAFIDDGSDSYNIILHPLKNEGKVKKAISSIGFEYHKKLKVIEDEDK